MNAWTLRWKTADKLEAWAKRLRPKIPETPREYPVLLRWPDAPASRPLSETLQKLTGEQ